MALLWGVIMGFRVLNRSLTNGVLRFGFRVVWGCLAVHSYGILKAW